MKDTSRIFLNTNRVHLDTINKSQSVRNLQIKPMLAILKEEFLPNYPSFDESEGDKIFQMVRDVYACYDKFLVEEKAATNPKKVKA
jgi:hypothetical protein